MPNTAALTTSPGPLHTTSLEAAAVPHLQWPQEKPKACELSSGSRKRGWQSRAEIRHPQSQPRLPTPSPAPDQLDTLIPVHPVWPTKHSRASKKGQNTLIGKRTVEVILPVCLQITKQSRVWALKWRCLWGRGAWLVQLSPGCHEGELGSILGLGRSSGGGRGNPLQYSCLENPHGQRSLVGYSPWDRKKLDTT